VDRKFIFTQSQTSPVKAGWGGRETVLGLVRSSCGLPTWDSRMHTRANGVVRITTLPVALGFHLKGYYRPPAWVTPLLGMEDAICADHVQSL
jgi:hypothetical protein